MFVFIFIYTIQTYTLLYIYPIQCPHTERISPRALRVVLRAILLLHTLTNSTRNTQFIVCSLEGGKTNKNQHSNVNAQLPRPTTRETRVSRAGPTAIVTESQRSLYLHTHTSSIKTAFSIIRKACATCFSLFSKKPAQGQRRQRGSLMCIMGTVKASLPEFAGRLLTPNLCVRVRV